MAKGSNQKLKLSILCKIMQEETDDDHSLIAVDVAISSQFFGWIFGLGSEVKVTSPEAVVKQMQDEAKAFLKNYE